MPYPGIGFLPLVIFQATGVMPPDDASVAMYGTPPTASGKGPVGVAIISSAAERNVLSGNSSGIYLTASGSTGNLLLGNFIGTDRFGTGKLGNSSFGVYVNGAEVTLVYGKLLLGELPGGDVGVAEKVVGPGTRVEHLTVGDRAGRPHVAHEVLCLDELVAKAIGIESLDRRGRAFALRRGEVG